VQALCVLIFKEQQAGEIGEGENKVDQNCLCQHSALAVSELTWHQAESQSWLRHHQDTFLFPGVLLWLCRLPTFYGNN